MRVGKNLNKKRDSIASNEGPLKKIQAFGSSVMDYQEDASLCTMEVARICRTGK